MKSDAELSPEFGGKCAFAVSLGKDAPPGKENCYVVRNGKKYLFLNPVAKLLWSVIPGGRKRAEANWSALSRRESHHEP